MMGTKMSDRHTRETVASLFAQYRVERAAIRTAWFAVGAGVLILALCVYDLFLAGDHPAD